MLKGIFGTNKNKVDKINEAWDGIKRNLPRSEKRESVNKYFKNLYSIIKEVARSKDESSYQLIGYLISEDYISLISKFCMTYPNLIDIICEYLSRIIREIKSTREDILNNKKMLDSFTQLILFFEGEIKKNPLGFKYKKEFAFLLNELTRLLLYHPNLIVAFKIIRKDEFSNDMTNDYIIFSNLLKLLELDQFISNYEYRKLIRRSIIVCLSFDEISYSSYLEKDSNLHSILVDKLCSYYQMLPSYFEFTRTKTTLEVGCCMNKTFSSLLDVYFDFKDYMIFLNKVTNCIQSVNIKNKFKCYLFNKFFIENVQNKILSFNQKIARSNFQYLIAFLLDVTNTEIIDTTAEFFFGFNDQKTARKFENQLGMEEGTENLSSSINIKDNQIKLPLGLEDMSEKYNYEKHNVSKISLRILSSLSNKDEFFDIVITELFEMFFKKRPYMMIHKFIKPYVDFCLKQSKTSFTPGPKKYPPINELITLVDYYEKFDRWNLVENIECNMYKTYSYYMKNDIEFYKYYLNQQNQNDELEVSSVKENGTEKSDTAILEESLNKGFQGKTAEKQPQKPKEKEPPSKPQENKEIVLEDKLFDETDEAQQESDNMNFLLMKNIQQKLRNYLSNSFTENIFLTNLILSIISVPCLQFDPELVECSAVLLDEDPLSKFSILTVIRYIAQEIKKIIKKTQNFDSLLNRKILELYQDDLIKEELYNKIKKKQTKHNPSTTITEIKKFEESLERKYNDSHIQNQLTNLVIFFEFLKEFISIISHKHRFEGIVEDIYGFYSNLLDEYYSDESNASKTVKD